MNFSNNKIKTLLAIALLLSLLISATACGGSSGGGGFTYNPPTESTEAETTGADEADLSALPENLRDNILLGSKYKGSCKELKGNVHITVVTANEPGTPWTEADIQALKVKHAEAATLMKNEAASYGIFLNLVFNYVPATVDYDLTMQNFSIWTVHAMERAGLPDLNTYGIEAPEKNYCDSATVFFCVNRPGRSFAIPGGNTEYTCLYEGAEDFRHELNHIFGAADYYFPDSLKAIAERYYPNSIMLGAKQPYVTDRFTAYLIGWAKDLSTDDLIFLNEVDLIPTTDFTNPEVSNTITGYVENHKYGEAYYTGNLIDGVPYGKGKMAYNDGSVYDGDWVYGNYEGKGKLTYANGSVYDGNWINGTYEGSGKFIYTDGSVYEGTWTKGAYEGNGKLTFADGSYYEGSFMAGKYHGYGIFKWTTGDCFKGNWSNGVQNGQGTYYYPDGSSFSGYWNNGVYTG